MWRDATEFLRGCTLLVVVLWVFKFLGIAECVAECACLIVVFLAHFLNFFCVSKKSFA